MTPEVVEAIIRTVKLGLPPQTAAAAHGVGASALKSHRQRHPEFATALEKAESDAIQNIWSRIILTAQGRPAEFEVQETTGKDGKTTRKTVKVRDELKPQWTAAAWCLERRWPHLFGKKDPDVSVSVDARTVNVGDEVRKDLRRMLRDERGVAAILDDLEAAQNKN